jgi:hypothetical protein
MKPLHVGEISSFLSRFANFEECEIRDITLKTPTVIELQFSVQDNGRGFDWIDIAIECSNVIDAKLIENTKLAYLDMSEGVSIIFEDNRFAICYGKYSTMKSIKDSSLYIECESLKYKELPFSG